MRFIELGVHERGVIGDAVVELVGIDTHTDGH